MKKMRILYDAQAFELQTHGGVSRCFVELSRHLPDNVEVRFGVAETDNVYLQDMGFPAIGDTYSRFLGMGDSKFKWLLFKLCYNIKYAQWKKLTCRPQLNLFEIERQFSSWNFDVFHPTFFDPSFLPALRKTGKPFVLTVHDMIAELYPQYFDPKAKHLQDKRILINAADHIVAVSEQTKQDLINLMGVDEKRITVIYHGADETLYIPTQGFSMGFDYILFVGARNLYKNFIGFVQGVLPLLREHTALKVVCTGIPFSTDEEDMLAATGMRDRFVQIFAKDDQHLSDLYHHAICFVYPSEYEGFGIPILESWRADCPVILNDIPVFREVAQDTVVYSHISHDGGDLTEKLHSIYNMSANERESLLSKQRERLCEFTWTKAAMQLENVYRNLIR